jgi:hypothetical protein
MAQDGSVPEVSGTVISAIRFLVNQVENAALQAYWEDRGTASDIYEIVDQARRSLDGLIPETPGRLSSCPWGCAARRCAPNC